MPAPSIPLFPSQNLSCPTAAPFASTPCCCSAPTSPPPTSPRPKPRCPKAPRQVIPLIEEQLLVGKQTVETGKVRLIKSVQEHQQALDEPLAVRTFDIERIILNHPVDAAPGIRHEGEVTIYPVVEEQLVLTKQLILREEIRVTQRDTERRDNQVVTLRREHLLIEREDLTK